MGKYCSNCGKEINDAKFCTFCGHKHIKGNPTHNDEMQQKMNKNNNIKKAKQPISDNKIKGIISFVCAAIGVLASFDGKTPQGIPVAVVFSIVGFIFFCLKGKSSSNSENNQNLKEKTSNNNEKYSYNKVAQNIDELESFIIKEYYCLNKQFSIITTFSILPEKVIEVIKDKKAFIFQNDCSCTVASLPYSDNRYKVDLDFTYTQGFKVFRTVLDNSLMIKLGVEDKQVYNEILKVFNNIISPNMSSLQKERIIHDYLISTSKYDYDNYKKGTIPDKSYTPYGLLFDYTAVCQAYAETFMIFMVLANIECYFVIGKAVPIDDNNNNKEDLHAWNIVKINGKYYHVDVTFDNPVPKVFGNVSHKFFNLTDELMDKTHSWDVSKYPFCD